MSHVETREGNGPVGVSHRRLRHGTQRHLPAASCGERLLKELGRSCIEKKQQHTIKVFDYADKKKLLFGSLSWPTELLAVGYGPKNKPLNDSWVIVTGSDAEFIKEPWILRDARMESAEQQGSV